ncbi:MAG: hypothetical protein L3J62_04690 [Gammaproteobacteria bacterium]|nr:hypothetical protein [Gammaproteobacteria bacterium]
MNILLLGEYSGMYRELKKGFLQLGHGVTHISGGDGWKAITSDTDLSFGLKGRAGFYATSIRGPFYLKALDLDSFDIIFACHAMVFSPLVPSFLFDFFFSRYKGRFFLSVAGNDFYTYQATKDKLNYTWFEGDILDQEGDPNYLRPKRIKLNEKVCSAAKGFVPVMYEYSLGYQDKGKPLRIIPLPFDVKEIGSPSNTVGNKVVFFHGISRPGFKGSNIITEAMNKLQKRYPNDVEVTTPTKLKYSKYVEELKIANVIIDQANSYSYGMNAIIGLSYGKQVLSGSEPEAIKALGVENCPVINIKPNSNDIFKQLQLCLEKRDSFEESGVSAREYVERVHDCKTVAEQYLDFAMLK